MENIYPLFERNRILKKELMWSLRDYSFNHIQSEYQSYADGIIKGCEIQVREGELVVGKGLIKHSGFIYLVTEEMTIPYEPTEQLEILKIKMETDKRSEDFIAYRMTLFLNHEPPKKEDELELCRFKLRNGSRLRSRYKDFGDMATDFDTVNVIGADWSGITDRTLSPVVTGFFAKTVLAENGSLPEDINFAYLCLYQPEAVSRTVLEHYIRMRLAGREDAQGEDGRRTEAAGDSVDSLDRNMKLFEQMAWIVKNIQGNRRKCMADQRKRKQIMVD